MDNLHLELYPLICEQIPHVYRQSALLSLALANRKLYSIVYPKLLYRYVQYPTEEIALKNLKRLQEDAQHQPEPLAHHIRDLCIITTITLPIRDPTTTSFHWLKELASLQGLKNLQALTTALYPAQGDFVADNGDGIGDVFSPWCAWDAVKNHCPVLEKVDMCGLPLTVDGCREWAFRNVISSMLLLKSIHLEGIIVPRQIAAGPPELLPRFPLLPSELVDLKFNVKTIGSFHREHHDKIIPEIIFADNFRNLQALRLANVRHGDPTKPLWEMYANLERLELHSTGSDNWFKGFKEGMFPNLKFLKASASQLRLVVPHIREQLVGLTIMRSSNAEALYLLRGITHGEPFPKLQYLGIHLQAKSFVEDEKAECYMETDLGNSQSSPDVQDLLSPPRFFDENYFWGISRAAPYLETLELMGPSKGPSSTQSSIHALAALLKRLPRVNHLILSGPTHFNYIHFFESSHSWEEFVKFTSRWISEESRRADPDSFDDAARTLAKECPSLEVLTFGYELGDLLIEPGISGRIIRGFDGSVQGVRRIKAWGSTLGREEEWY